MKSFSHAGSMADAGLASITPSSTRCSEEPFEHRAVAVHARLDDGGERLVEGSAPAVAGPRVHRVVELDLHDQKFFQNGCTRLKIEPLGSSAPTQYAGASHP